MPKKTNKHINDTPQIDKARETATDAEQKIISQNQEKPSKRDTILVVVITFAILAFVGFYWYKH